MSIQPWKPSPLIWWNRIMKRNQLKTLARALGASYKQRPVMHINEILDCYSSLALKCSYLLWMWLLKSWMISTRLYQPSKCVHWRDFYEFKVFWLVWSSTKSWLLCGWCARRSFLAFFEPILVRRVSLGYVRLPTCVLHPVHYSMETVTQQKLQDIDRCAEPIHGSWRCPLVACISWGIRVCGLRMDNNCDLP